MWDGSAPSVLFPNCRNSKKVKISSLIHASQKSLLPIRVRNQLANLKITCTLTRQRLLGRISMKTRFCCSAVIFLLLFLTSCNKNHCCDKNRADKVRTREDRVP